MAPTDAFPWSLRPRGEVSFSRQQRPVLNGASRTWNLQGQPRQEPRPWGEPD